MNKSVWGVSIFCAITICSLTGKIWSGEESRIFKSSPQDLSFCIADVKFDTQGEQGSTIKVLELGEGSRSKFKGHDSLYGTGAMWSLFWSHLAQFELPIWLVGLSDDDEIRTEINFELFEKMGGKTASTITELTSKINRDIEQSYGVVTEQHRQAYFGIVIIKRGRPVLTVKKMKESFPNLVFVGERSNKFVNNKYRTDQLFSSAELKKYRPQCKSCSIEYDPSLADQLMSEFECNIFVLKPINSSRGRGVIIVSKEELASTLKLILTDHESLMNSSLPDEYIYWATYKSPNFLVEQYEPSKTIFVDNKPYDATMRLVFTLDYIDGNVQAKVLDGYWKLPAYPLTAECSLTDKHKSHVVPDLLSAEKINFDDMAEAKELLENMLFKLYWQMLQSAHSQSLKIEPFDMFEIM